MNVSRPMKMRPRRLLNLLAAAGLLLSSAGMLPPVTAHAGANVGANEGADAGADAGANAETGQRTTGTALFGWLEIRNEKLAAFTKWTGMLARLGTETPQASPLDFVPAGNRLAELNAVNRMVNAVSYVSDEENWGAADHWATPGEFYSRSGDCEDFAIAKYVALKQLGFDPASMRIVVLVDRQRHKYHAVLMIDTDMGRLILDNQIAEVVRDTDIKHYQPIYSINESAWWLHVAKPQTKLVAQRNP